MTIISILRSIDLTDLLILFFQRKNSRQVPLVGGTEGRDGEGKGGEAILEWGQPTLRGAVWCDG